MAKTLSIDSPIKIITSGSMPTTTNLPKGSIGVGKVNGRLAAVAALGTTTSDIQDLLQYDTIEGENATVTDFGGIKSGTKASDLKGKPLSEILDTLLFPTVNPTFVSPSATISATTKTGTIFEVGATLPADTTFSYTFNKGSINIAGVKKADRSGDVTAATLMKTSPISRTGQGQYSFYYNVSYAQGPQPTDSKGNNYSTPLAAGAIRTTNIIVYYAEYPYFANTTTADTLTKLPLTTNSYFEASCVSESGTNRHMFALPAAYTVTKIEYFDTVANTYNTMNVSDFTATSYTVAVQGNSTSYNKYVRNTTGLSAATKFRITFTK